MKQPSSWQAAYDKLAGIANEEIHRQADELALAFGDRRVLPRMREILADPNAPTPRRVKALATLVNGRDEKAVPLLHNILAHADLRGPALRALANFDDEGNARTYLVSLWDVYRHGKTRCCPDTYVTS